MQIVWNHSRHVTRYILTLAIIGKQQFPVTGRKMVRFSLSIVTTVLFAVTVAAQTVIPFPDGMTYAQGFMPATLDDTLLVSEYSRWKKLFLVECNGGYRVTGENSGETRVEGIGFGMIITAYCGKKTEFDGLLKFYKSKRTASAGQMMAWQVSCSGINDQGSATDGDIDVAFSLIIAGCQWGGTYLDEAKTIIGILKDNVIKTCSSDILSLATGVSGGTAWGGCDMTDISYYNPAFFRVFADLTNDDTWDKLADDTYTILNNGANPSTGLVPDWQSVSGTPGAGGREGTFRYDACRAPYRIAIDYLWNGNEKSKAWCTKITDWASKIGPAKIMDGYSLSGNATGSSNTTSFVGSFAVAAMCNSQSITDAFCTQVNKLRDQKWFNLSTRLCYLLALTGNLWPPAITENRSAPSFHLKQTASVTLRRSGHELTIQNASDLTTIDIRSFSGRLLYRQTTGGERKIQMSIPAGVRGGVVFTAHDFRGTARYLGKVILL